ncbi:hypothetical protein [Flavobacterium johnsoniae]|uniref:Uncharacterized protein n=1 Tax=Flavobacterium johnsoniae TaxID=986 RepID=A0A1M5IL02_FLAJO|nr:hypothetical protein [Flavobacterium johnsoniae]SHG28453.1 hypothetical protein SAMN05444388_102130 [Flavobacterium johnsoniae]
MEYLINVGYAIICALGLVVFLVLIWFSIGLCLAMKDIFFSRKRKNRDFINHDDIIKKSE